MERGKEKYFTQKKKPTSTAMYEVATLTKKM
jgi:hypothetical protein